MAMHPTMKAFGEPTMKAFGDTVKSFGDGSTGSVGTGKHEGEMKSFIEQHLLCLLRPTAEHVRELTDTLSTLQKDFNLQGAVVDRCVSRLDQHEQRISTLSDESIESDKRMKKGLADASNQLVEKAKSLRARMDDIGSKLEEQLQDANSRLEMLQMSWNTSDANIAQLQKGANEQKADSISFAATLSQMDKLLEGWRHEHLGMSDRLEHTKRQGEDMSHLLKKLEMNTTSQYKKLSESINRLNNKQLPVLEAKMSSLKDAMGEQDRQLGSHSDEVKGLAAELKAMQGDLKEEIKTNKEQEATMRKLNVRQAIDVLFQRIEKANEDCANLLTELQEEEGAMRTVQATVEKINTDLARQSSDLSFLDKTQQSLGFQFRDASDRLKKQETENGHLKERTEKAEIDIRNLMSYKKDSQIKADAQTVSLEKLAARQGASESRLDNTDGQLRNLREELTANDEATQKTAISLDLAHEYLTGVSKGFQNAHKQVLCGQEDMLPYKQKPRTLPSLPGSNSATMSG